MSNVAIMQKDQVSALADFGAEDGPVFDGTLLKFTKGDYLIGRDGEDLKAGTQVVAVVPTIVSGWQRWWNGKPTAAKLGSVADGFRTPSRASLGEEDSSRWEVDEITGDRKDPWSPLMFVAMVEVDNGRVLTFTTSSLGGQKAIRKLAKDFAQGTHGNPGKYPVVSLEVGSYMHENKSFGRIKYPQFDLVEWVPVKAYDDMICKGRGVPAQPLLQLAAPAEPEASPIKPKFTKRAGKKGPDDPDDPIPF